MKLLPKILSGYLVVITILVVVGVVLVTSISSVTDTFDDVEASSEIEDNGYQLEKLMLDMETGLRGYLITGNDDFLAPYNAAVDEFDVVLEETKTMSADKPEQVARLQKIGTLKEQWISDVAVPEIELRQMANSASTTTDDLATMVGSGEGKRRTDEIRAELESIKVDLDNNETEGDTSQSLIVLADLLSMETGLRGYLITGDETFLEPYNEGQTEIKTNINQLRSILRRNNDTVNLSRLDRVEDLVQEWIDEVAGPQLAARESVNQNHVGLQDIAAFVASGAGKDTTDSMRAEFTEFLRIETQSTNDAMEEARNTGKTAQNLAIGISLLGVLVGISIGVYLSRSISSRVSMITSDTKALTEGKLTQRSIVKGEDEVATLATNFNTMAERLETMVSNEVTARKTLEDTVAEYMTFVENVAMGDLKKRLQIRGNNGDDPLIRLGSNLNKMVDGLDDMTRRVEQAAENERQARELLQASVDDYVLFVEAVSQGNLTQRLSMKRNGNGNGRNYHEDQLLKLGDNLNRMVNSLADMTGQTREVSLKIASATAEILAATTQQLSSATEQDTSINQTSTTAREVLATVTQTAERAESVAKVAQRSVEVSQQGQQAVRESVDGMQMIRHQVEAIAENILALSEKTQQIGQIIASVNDIAEQSKVLALNASIEAARAGEEGKSFAVVAMEVRNLAEQSREATDQVREILNEIQQATNTAVMATEEGIKGVDTGQSLINRAGQTIQDLAGVIREAAQSASQIAASTHQQTVGMDQLSAAMGSIRQASIQTTASVQQAERSAQDLNAMAKQMQETVARYSL